MAPEQFIGFPHLFAYKLLAFNERQTDLLPTPSGILALQGRGECSLSAQAITTKTHLYFTPFLNSIKPS